MTRIGLNFQRKDLGNFLLKEIEEVLKQKNRIESFGLKKIADSFVNDIDYKTNNDYTTTPTQSKSGVSLSTVLP